MALDAGTELGHYRIPAPLGEGGMGEVYLAEDTKLHRNAAIKLIAPDLARDASRRQRFVQEAMLAAAIDHPHIAAIYDIDQVGDHIFIAMEYVPGKTLRHFLRGPPLALKRAVDLGIQIGDAFAKMHERGVIHRDLKPDNVILSTDGYAKVIDFGLAKLTKPAEAAASHATVSDVHARTAEGVVLGTVAYMSPEQARGEPLDSRSDIFSFGVLLHTMLSGAVPSAARASPRPSAPCSLRRPRPCGWTIQQSARTCSGSFANVWSRIPRAVIRR